MNFISVGFSILIAFVSWEMSEGATFPDIESFKPLLAAKFVTLWYSSDMNKRWQSNVVFHTYYLQLKRASHDYEYLTNVLNPNEVQRKSTLHLHYSASR
jgi:hypothetical protein